LRAARAIDYALDSINEKLESELGQPLEVSIGISGGTLLLGRIGYGEAIDFTVIGTPVNIASRLEGLAKEKGFQIMLTRDVAREASWEPSTEFTMTVDVRGVGEPVEVIGIPRGRDLASNILALSDEDKATHKPRGWIQGLWRGA
jgi:adenylate cyclase